MREAEKLDLDVFVHALEAGLGVYKRLGFCIERELDYNDYKFWGPGGHSVDFMVYKPKQTE
jgi:hypothetical protein